MTPGDGISRLLGALDEVRRSGNGWIARCPAHDDSRPSLAIAEGLDGRGLVHCHAGCETDAVVAALGWTMSELFDDFTSNDKWDGQDAAAALTNRGFRPETIRRFRVTANLEKQAWEFPLGKDKGMKFKAFSANGKRPKYWTSLGTKAGLAGRQSRFGVDCRTSPFTAT